MSSWLFQGSPDFYKVRPALHHFLKVSRPTTWLVNKHKSRIRAGDEVFFWEAGPEAGLVGWGTVERDPAKIPLDPEELEFVVEKRKFDGVRLRVRIRVEGTCYRSRTDLRRTTSLSNWQPAARGVQGTNFAVPADVAQELRRVVSEAGEL